MAIGNVFSAFFGGISTRTWIILVVVFSVGLILYLGYNHISNLLDERENLLIENAQFKTALESQKEATAAALKGVENWQRAYQDQQQTTQRMIEIQQEATKEARRLDEIFSSHDLSALAAAKPKLVERRVNTGTGNSNRMLRCAASPALPECAN